MKTDREFGIMFGGLIGKRVDLFGGFGWKYLVEHGRFIWRKMVEVFGRKW